MNQSNEKAVVLTQDQLFDQQKAKANLLHEIFNNKEFFFQDVIIKNFFQGYTKLTNKRFIWLKNRVNNLKLINKMSTTCEHKKLKRTFYFIPGKLGGFVSREPHVCAVCGEEVVHEFQNGFTVQKYNFNQIFST